MQRKNDRFEKTDKAREVLARARSGSANVMERRVLILADGQRGLDDIAAALGGVDVIAVVQGLVDKGYLVPAPDPEPASADTAPPEEPSSPLAPLLRGAAARLRRAIAEPAPQAPEPARPRVPDTAIRSGRSSKESLLARAPPPRSVIAAKTHIIDLFEERDRPLGAIDTIRKARGEHNVALVILDAVRALHRDGETALRDEAIAMLDDLLPEDYLPALRAIRDRPIDGDPAPSRR